MPFATTLNTGTRIVSMLSDHFIMTIIVMIISAPWFIILIMADQHMVVVNDLLMSIYAAAAFSVYFNKDIYLGQSIGKRLLRFKVGLRRRVIFVVRVFNDGVAFRDSIPVQAGWEAYSLVDEGSTFRVSGDPMVMASYREGFTTSHEGLYVKKRLSEVREDTLMDMPIFLDYGGVYAAITEARLVDYAGMYLIRHGDVLKSELSPWPY